jgi:dCMP deaminase
MNWLDYGMGLAKAASMRSKDPWRKVGAVVMRHDNSVAGVGYNGFPAGMWEDWQDREARRKFVIHAEANALRYCKPKEVGVMCVTTLPCNECLRLAAGYGIRKIAYGERYEFDDSTIEIADYFGIELICVK